jgi:predicted PP-loop superfamily ATPase
MHGSHCSCYGFEGQFKLEETTTEALKSRVENARSRNQEDEDEHAIFQVGGYDSDATNNARIINNYINSL